MLILDEDIIAGNILPVPLKFDGLPTPLSKIHGAMWPGNIDQICKFTQRDDIILFFIKLQKSSLHQTFTSRHKDPYISIVIFSLTL